MRIRTLYLSGLAVIMLLAVLSAGYWMWHRKSTASIATVPQKTCSPCVQTVVLSYADFGPPSMSYELHIGSAWNQWKNAGHELPDDVDIRVVVYRGIELAEVRKQFPVVRGKSDYRYVEYTRAVRFLQENVKIVESYKRAASDANEIEIWDRLAQTLMKTHERIIESLGGNMGGHSATSPYSI
jgi:hypothetical protein